MSYIKLEDAVKAVEATLSFSMKQHMLDALRSLPTDDGWEDIATAKELFEKWARQNVGQFSPGGYHGTNGVWVYRHNIQQLMWQCWRASRSTTSPALLANNRGKG